ncbi:5514_t:CDS:1, partial [Dentiscutata heterogama]
VVHQIFKKMSLFSAIIRSANQDGSFILMTKEQQKYLELLLYEWVILESQTLQMLEFSLF